MKIKLKRVSCSKYKVVNDFEIGINDKMICITGENSTGKSTLLDAVTYKGSHEDLLLSEITWYFDVNPENRYSTDENTLEVVMKKKKGNEGIELVEVNGLDNLVKDMKIRIVDLEERYVTVLRDIRESMLAVKKHFNSYFDSDIYMDYKKFNIYPENRYEIIREEVNRIQEEDFTFEFMFDEKKFYYGLKFPDYRYDKENFAFSYIPKDKYDQFKKHFQDATIEKDGFYYDFDKVEDKYNKTVERHKAFELMIGNTFDNFEKSENDIEGFEDELRGIKNEINTLHSDLYSACFDYIMSMKLIRESGSRQYHSNAVLSKDEKQILKCFGFDYLLGRKLQDMSSGERWMVNFATRLNEKEYSLLVLDEPAENLNPILQSKLVDFLELELKKGKQIIYATHSVFMMGVNKRNDIYYLNRDNTSDLIKFDYSNIENLNQFNIENILVHAARTILLVEGPTDKLLVEYALGFINSDVLNDYIEVYDCIGHGIKPMIKLCIELNIDFKALMDKDKEEELRLYIENQYDKYKDNFYYFGENDEDEIENLFSNRDLELICELKNGEYKMKSKKIKALNSNKCELSPELIDEIKKSLKSLQII